ncbi:MAG: DUF4328 domain-containing protein [Erythrobacter sp.]|nr:MAG: DUF4328 domain-containing protein [Erythrobacter sp.]
MQSGIRALGSLGTVVRIVLWLFIAGCVLTILLQLSAIFASEAIFSNPEVFGVATMAAGGIQLLAFLASIVVIALWLHRAHGNLHESGLGGLNYSASWATASFFIPFVNLYVPFASTRELWNRSHGESDWHAAASAGDVTSWAACNWGAFVVFCALLGYVALDSIPNLYVLLPTWGWLGMSVLLYIFLAGSAWFVMQFVRKITDAQQSGAHLSQSDVFA